MREKVSSSESKLSSQVAELRSKLQQIAEKPKKDLADFSLACEIEDQLVTLERQLALENGVQAAFRIPDWPVKITMFDRLLGTVSVGQSLLVWHEISRVKSPRIAISECSWCFAVQRAASSEAGFFSHPFYRHGLDGLGVFVIQNSEWKQSLSRRLKLKSDGVDNWSISKHYLFIFEDSILEFIGTGLNFVNVYETRAEAEQETLARLSMLFGLLR